MFLIQFMTFRHLQRKINKNSTDDVLRTFEQSSNRNMNKIVFLILCHSSDVIKCLSNTVLSEQVGPVYAF